MVSCYKTYLGISFKRENGEMKGFSSDRYDWIGHK